MVMMITDRFIRCFKKKTGTDDEMELKHGMKNDAAVHDYMQQPLSYLCVYTTLNMHTKKVIMKVILCLSELTYFMSAHCLTF